MNKIDFAVVITVDKANPNGDPLNGGRPRQDYNGIGEISDVCIKRKIRNRLQDMGQQIFVQSADRCDDGMPSLHARAQAYEDFWSAVKAGDDDAAKKAACEKWLDVRTFGQLFAFQKTSLGIRGPVSIMSSDSVSPVEVTSYQITKSVNSETQEKLGDMDPSRMGTKHRVEFGVYTIRGSINAYLADKTGFNEEDAELVLKALKTIWENDSSSARPEGSMAVRKMVVWRHNCISGQYSAAQVQRTLQLKLKDGVEMPTKYEDYDITLTNLDGLQTDVEDF